MVPLRVSAHRPLRAELTGGRCRDHPAYLHHRKGLAKRRHPPYCHIRRDLPLTHHRTRRSKTTCLPRPLPLRPPVAPAPPHARTSPAGLPHRRPRRHPHRPADGRARRDHRQRRPAPRCRRRSTSPRPACRGCSTPTPSPSADCCCSARGPVTCSAGAGSSSPGSALFARGLLRRRLGHHLGWLVAARAAQGVGAALAAPAVLALLMTTFAEGRERTRALGLFTARLHRRRRGRPHRRRHAHRSGSRGAG